jgi:septum formation protein
MLILASQSPRRRELLAQAGYTFEVQPSSCPETRQEGEDGIPFAIRLAREKAEAVFALRQAPALQLPPQDAGPLVVLGADTVVLLDGEVLGKPASPADASRMLHRLSGKTHQVVTGVAVVAGYGSPVVADSVAEVTQVTMLALSEQEIAGYVATGEPMDKAGAYAIQGYAGRWIPRIHGCYFNVVGLPIALVATLLEGTQDRLDRMGKLTAQS